MKVVETLFPEVKILEPTIYKDERGFFMEAYNDEKICSLLGDSIRFVQDNQSHSKKGVLRGLHYQLAPMGQGKLVRVVSGEVLDVVVDVRESSTAFGHWFSVILSSQNHRQLWIPPGFAHGFYVRSETADYLYKTTQYYSPQHERSIVWNDSALGIDWSISSAKPIISPKDAGAPSFELAEHC